MKLNKNLVFVGFLVFILVLVTCTFSISQPEANTSEYSSLTYEEISGFGYMGGSLIVNEKTPIEGHIVKDVVIPVRFGTVEMFESEGEKLYSDISEKKTFGFMYITALDVGKISFDFTSINSDNTRSTKKNLAIAVGEKLDLNGDGISDICYQDIKESKPGFENTKVLTFISSQENKKTTMFACRSEQYPNGYPQGLIGINPNGKFIFTKHQSAGSSSGSRLSTQSIATVKGIEEGDFILDIETGTYFEAEKVEDMSNIRAFSAAKLKSRRKVDITEVLPLASWKASVRQIPDKNIKAVKKPYIAQNYTDFESKRAYIRTQFESFKPIFVIRPEEILAYSLDAIEKIPISSSDLPNISGKDQLLLETAVGLFGDLSISWSHFESNLAIGVFVDTSVDLSVNESLQSKDFGVPAKNFLQDKYTFMAGPVPITLACPMSFVLPITAKLEGDKEFGFFAGFTGLYVAGADFGWSTNWDALKKQNNQPEKKFIESFAKKYVINDAVAFAGSKNGLYTETKAHIKANIKLAPKFLMAPEIGIANVVSTGFSGSYEMPLILGIMARQQAENAEKFDLYGNIELYHNAKLYWNLKALTFQKLKIPIIETGEKKIDSWEIRF